MDWKEKYLNKVVCGDCLELLPELPDGVIDMILCDLPYGKTDFSWDNFNQIKKLWVEYHRIIKSNGVVALHAVQPFTTDLIISNRASFKYSYVWIKTQGANFQLAKYMPLKKHEDICIFYNRTPITYNPQKIKGEPKPKRIGKEVYQQRKKDMYLASKPNNLTTVISDEYYPTTVLNYVSEPRNKSLHPTQKPIPLEEFLIKTYTNEGDLVLDNCIGSGTTAVACENLKRKWVGMEIEEKYCEIARKRLEQESSKSIF